MRNARYWHAFYSLSLTMLAVTVLDCAHGDIASASASARAKRSPSTDASKETCKDDNSPLPVVADPMAGLGPGCPYGKMTSEEALKSPSGKLIEDLVGDKELQYDLNGDFVFRMALQEDPDIKDLVKGRAEFRQRWLDNLSVKELMDTPSGVAEGYTIREHTARVLQIFEQQRLMNGLEQMPEKPGVTDWDNLLRMTLAFHDIGKGIAAYLGDKSLEEHFSVPLARGLMRARGFSSEEVDIAKELIAQHQLLGAYIRGFISANDTRDRIRFSAAKAGLKPEDFLRLEIAIYKADAGAYPSLCDSVFATDLAGKMHVREEKKLQDLFPPPPSVSKCMETGSPLVRMPGQ